MSIRLADPDDDEPLTPSQPEPRVIDAEYSIVPFRSTATADMAFQDYLNLGPSRSVTALQKQYATRKARDQYAPIPTDDIQVLLAWKQQYHWDTLAYEHDATAARAYQQHRKSLLTTVFQLQNDRADKVLQLAEDAIDKMTPERLSPSDALKFVDVGMKLKKEANERLVQLDNPDNETDSASSGDMWDVMRNMVLNNVGNTIHVHGDVNR